jgi:RecA/RadA recombinase
MSARVTRPAIRRRAVTLPKSPTGITGLDEITGGGLPTGRPTLVCGSAGCGKTMLAMEFLVRGATQFGEPGVFMMFEENARELTDNVRLLGFDLDQLVAKKTSPRPWTRGCCCAMWSSTASATGRSTC